jgi:hypothetical protein
LAALFGDESLSAWMLAEEVFLLRSQSNVHGKLMIASAPARAMSPTASPSERSASTPDNTADKSDFACSAIERELRSVGLFPLREVGLFIEDDVVVLHGTVRSYHDKQLAQQIVMKIAPTFRVENRCEVKETSVRQFKEEKTC